MTTIKEILHSKRKPRETVELLADALKRDQKLTDELVQCFADGTTAEQGACMEALETITKDNPEFAETCLDWVMEHLNDQAPRVRWEACRIIANVAQKFPAKIQEAVPRLLENTHDAGTVVRWSAAFALSEVAKSSPEMQHKLVPEFKQILAREDNTGVRNIYLKYLKLEGCAR